MQPRHHVSPAAIALIKRFEGYRRTAAQLADGHWTIGYGHTRSAREGAQVSEADAEALLLYDLQEVAAAINSLIFTPLTQNQVDALASFVLNIGVASFQSSSVLRRINEGNLLQAGCAIEMWRKADFEGERIVVDALVRRRAAEKGLFLTPADGYVPAPTPVVRPRLDYSVRAGMPQTRPVELDTPMEGDSAVAVRHDAPEIEAQTDAPYPDDRGSPTVAAAAAVSARLHAIMDDFDGTAPAPETAETEAPAADAPVDAFPFAAPEAHVPVVEVANAEPELAAPEAPAAPVEPVTEPAAPAEPVESIAASEPVAGPQGAPAADTSSPPLMRLVDPMVEYSEPAPHAPLFGDNGRAGRSPQPLPPYPAEWAARPAEPVEWAARPEPIATGADLFDRGNYQEPAGFETGDFDASHIEPLRAGYLPLIFMVLVGLAVFAGAIFWVFAARPSFGSAGPAVVGWIVGLIGIGMLASSVYFLLERLGGNGHDEQDR
jgi:lysozyme